MAKAKLNLVGLILALVVLLFAESATAQDQTLTADPASVPEAGTYEITLTPSGFTSTATNLVVCNTGNESVEWSAATLMQHCGGFGGPINATDGPITVSDVEITEDGVTFLIFELREDGEAALVRVIVSMDDTDINARRSGVRTRDSLIAAQESLLNVYRCRFGIDTQVVPGGCRGGQPARPPAEPSPFLGTPTSHEIGVRDELVASQEALLNVYRCRFVIDTHIVPGGCSGGVPSNTKGRISVPQAPPSGRCAHSIADGTYDWEECAWDGYWDDRNYNHSLSDSEGQSLIERIWVEVNVEGKPAQPPTSELVPAGSTCATAVEGGIIIACYQHSRHHIRRLDSFLQTLLHETAHALVALHPSIQACQVHSAPNDYNTCVHNDIFRCVSDHLNVHYAGIPSAGVCGKAEHPPKAPDDTHGWDSYGLDGGGRMAGTPSYVHSRGFPYEDSDDWLFVRCDEGHLDVYLSFEHGYLAGQYLRDDGIPVAYVFLPGDFFSWDDTRQSDFVASNRQWGLWGESIDNRAAFLPHSREEDFINAAVSSQSGWLLVSVENWDSSDFGVFIFSLSDAYTHIRPVTEECGWVWQ